jgi:hypothetical protein
MCGTDLQNPSYSPSRRYSCFLSRKSSPGSPDTPISRPLQESRMPLQQSRIRCRVITRQVHPGSSVRGPDQKRLHYVLNGTSIPLRNTWLSPLTVGEEAASLSVDTWLATFHLTKLEVHPGNPPWTHRFVLSTLLPFKATILRLERDGTHETLNRPSRRSRVGGKSDQIGARVIRTSSRLSGTNSAAWTSLQTAKKFNGGYQGHS